VKKLRLMIIGQGGHGKDYMGEILSERGYNSISPSLFCASEVVYPHMKDQYTSFEEFYNDRKNHRAFWYEKINKYCGDNLARVGEGIYETFEICCGVRDQGELHAIRDKGLYDFCIWVDAYDRLGDTEDESSMTVTKEDADFIIYNNGDRLEFIEAVDELYQQLYFERFDELPEDRGFTWLATKNNPYYPCVVHCKSKVEAMAHIEEWKEEFDDDGGKYNCKFTVARVDESFSFKSNY